MKTPELSRLVELQRLYNNASSDPDFTQILKSFKLDDDAELADLIEADGRLRIRLARPVDLERYMAAISNLRERSDPLDAAIDMTLRALAMTRHTDERVMERLVELHPELESSIRETAALNNAVWSTMTIRKQVSKITLKELPSNFGTVIHTGTRRYELLELLGEGAFGQVYLAVDRQLSEKDHPALVSIKVIPGEGRSSLMRQQLTDEATKARRIDHPNVIRVIDRGTSDEDENFIVYEYVEGGDLGKHIRRCKDSITVREVIRIASSVARGVHEAHMAGLVHCDLKPTNIVMTADGDPKVADFGVAIRIDSPEISHEAPSDGQEPMGNLAFMSPEQFHLEPGSLTIPSDIYALGGILYWMLSNELPNGATPEAIAKIHDTVTGRSESPSVIAICDKADCDLDAIVRKAMAVDPGERYSSAAALADDLDAWSRREPLLWTRPGIARRMLLWVRRKPAIAAMLLLVIALATTGTVVGIRATFVEAYARQEEEFRILHKKNLTLFANRMIQAIEQNFEEHALTAIWISQWLYEPTEFSPEQERFDLLEMRIKVVRKLLKKEKEKEKESGGEFYFKTMLWESALGFWLIKDEAYQEAELILQQNITKWQSILHPDDPWLSHLRGMQACVQVGKLVDGNSNQADSKLSIQELRSIEATLVNIDQSLQEDHPGSPLRFMISEHLEIIYGPNILNQPKDAERIAENLKKLME
ncbi:MAG: serine/threonine protein kinase [Planctomycetes bacterium]|nr:serine/threonine protein kinase [Planctomycetota bacterium]